MKSIRVTTTPEQYSLENLPVTTIRFHRHRRPSIPPSRPFASTVTADHRFHRHRRPSLPPSPPTIVSTVTVDPHFLRHGQLETSSHTRQFRRKSLRKIVRCPTCRTVGNVTTGAILHSFPDTIHVGSHPFRQNLGRGGKLSGKAHGWHRYPDAVRLVRPSPSRKEMIAGDHGIAVHECYPLGV